MTDKNPTLRIQAHCQVARKAHRQDQNLSISLPALPHRQKCPVANKRSYCIPQFVVNMNIRLIKLIYLYTEKYVILMRYAA